MQKNLRIAVVCDSIGITLGGSTNSAKRFIRELKSRGHFILLITNEIKDKSDPVFQDIIIDENPSIPIVSRKKFAFAYLDQDKVEDLCVKHKIDLIYSIYPTSYSGFTAIQISKQLKVPLAAHFHVQVENISTIIPKIGLDSLVYKFFVKFYNQSSVVICPTEFAKSILVSHGLIANTTVISNGVNLDRFKVLHSESIRYLHEKYEIPHFSKYLVYIGRLDKEKDLPTLLEAFKIIYSQNIKDVGLIIAGTGSEKEKIVDFIEENNLTNNIIVLGKLPPEDLVPLYNLATIFVSPSLTELEGMTVLEAMACSKPIIVSNSPASAAKYFINENGFIFEAENPSDLAENLEVLITNDELLQKMGEKSLIDVQKYNFKRSVDQLEDLFHSIVGKHT